MLVYIEIATGAPSLLVGLEMIIGHLRTLLFTSQSSENILHMDGKTFQREKNLHVFYNFSLNHKSSLMISLSIIYGLIGKQY